ncbi:MAG TPA: FprA family A-type flavoprotein, partial [Thermovirgaceae bacterium]|nr:FprA family A-type flavoprotein [Thermovirgaceae bacterium]
MNVFEIRKDIFWVGAIDWELRDFHGYSTERGSTYNAFLVMDEKKTLMDSVKSTKTDELLTRV